MRDAGAGMWGLLNGVVGAKFGPGTIGRLGTVAIAGAVLMISVALVLAFTEPVLALVPMLVAAAIIFFMLFKGFEYAERNPHLAAMDGTQIAKLLTQDAAMKPLPGMPPQPLLDARPVQNPEVEPARAGDNGL